ncbi:MAG: hypothetical protein K2X98_04720 [Alphaproteobacteria bacterium]|nr:hypothetical protein [Alphaproteobacteria bacterium]
MFLIHIAIVVLYFCSPVTGMDDNIAKPRVRCSNKGFPRPDSTNFGVHIPYKNGFYCARISHFSSKDMDYFTKIDREHPKDALLVIEDKGGWNDVYFEEICAEIKRDYARQLIVLILQSEGITSLKPLIHIRDNLVSLTLHECKGIKTLDVLSAGFSNLRHLWFDKYKHNPNRDMVSYQDDFYGLACLEKLKTIYFWNAFLNNDGKFEMDYAVLLKNSLKENNLEIEGCGDYKPAQNGDCVIA